MTSDTESGFVLLRGGRRISYRIDGATHLGTPMLLLRPLGGTIELWGKFREILAQKYRIIAFDYSGTGLSSHDPAWLSTSTLAQEALAVLDDRKIAEAHVFGISLGGMTACALASSAPSRVAKLCIASVPLRGVTLTHTGLRRELAMARCFFETADRVEMKLVDRVLSRRFRAEHPAEVEAIERIVEHRPASRAALLKHALAGLLHDARRDVARIVAPTLVLAGDRDSLLGVDAPRALARAIAGATFEIVPDAGHDVTLEQPIFTANRVLRFIAS